MRVLLGVPVQTANVLGHGDGAVLPTPARGCQITNCTAEQPISVRWSRGTQLLSSQLPVLTNNHLFVRYTIM